jgi:CheY-like chemotaxis protein
MPQSLLSKSFVLYADDDHEDRDLVKEAFMSYSGSIELKTFESGVELLKYIHSSKSDTLPCLIVLDINMPLMNGKEVLRNLRCLKDYEEVPVVLFSTSTLPSEKAFAKSFDAVFMTKPLHMSQMYELVDKMLEHCHDDVRKTFKKYRDKTKTNVLYTLSLRLFVVLSSQ